MLVGLLFQPAGGLSLGVPFRTMLSKEGGGGVGAMFGCVELGMRNTLTSVPSGGLSWFNRGKRWKLQRIQVSSVLENWE